MQEIKTILETQGLEAAEVTFGKKIRYREIKELTASDKRWLQEYPSLILQIDPDIGVNWADDANSHALKQWVHEPTVIKRWAKRLAQKETINYTELGWVLEEIEQGPIGPITQLLLNLNTGNTTVLEHICKYQRITTTTKAAMQIARPENKLERPLKRWLEIAIWWIAPNLREWLPTREQSQLKKKLGTTTENKITSAEWRAAIKWLQETPNTPWTDCESLMTLVGEQMGRKTIRDYSEELLDHWWKEPEKALWLGRKLTQERQKNSHGTWLRVDKTTILEISSEGDKACRAKEIGQRQWVRNLARRVIYPTGSDKKAMIHIETELARLESRIRHQRPGTETNSLETWILGVCERAELCCWTRGLKELIQTLDEKTNTRIKQAIIHCVLSNIHKILLKKMVGRINQKMAGEQIREWASLHNALPQKDQTTLPPEALSELL